MRRRGRFWDRRRREALDRDGWRCRDCGRAGALQVHHIVPIEAGGTDDLDNLRSLCKDCHHKRHRRPRSAAVKAWHGLVQAMLRE